MLRVSGPISSAAFTLGKTNIILLGDRHDSKKDMCRSCKKEKNCVHVIDFMENLKHPIDIFIEAPWTRESDKAFLYTLPSVDVISNVSNKYLSSMYQHKQQSKGQRVHYIDIRHDDILIEFVLIIFSEIFILQSDPLQHKIHASRDILECFKKTQDFKDLANILVLSDEFNTSIIEKFGKERSHYFIGKDNLTNIPGTTKRTIHRVRKQFLKLSSPDRKILLKFHKDRCKEIIMKTKDYNEYIKHKDKNKNATDQNGSVFYTLLLWMTHIMDMYTLSRILYYMYTEKKSHTVVVYAGADHTFAYTRFFLNYKKAKFVHYNKNESKRCVTLPLEFVQKVSL